VALDRDSLVVSIMVRSGWWVEGVGMKGARGATEGCANGSSSNLVTNSAPGCGERQEVVLAGNIESL